MKVPLRKHLRAQRRSLGTADHRYRSKLAAKAVAGMPMFRSGKRVALYLPFDREADTAVLIAAARRRGVRLFVPVINWPGPRLVGLAFDCQRTESSFAEPWDVSLDSLATESGLQHYSKGAL